MPTLSSCLGETETVPLGFGTSGRRGLLRHLSQLEVALNAWGELQFLQSLPVEDGGIVPGDTVYLAHDLRPSSSRLIDTTPCRGELAQALVWATRQAGMIPVNVGAIPTPALACHALSQGKACMMVTGSHIPFDRNGYKTYTAIGELTKAQEPLIAGHVARIRQRLYAESSETTCFRPDGQFRAGSQPLPPASGEASRIYRQRYLDFFGPEALAGLTLMVYQHSAVGRDLLCDILTDLGGQVVPVGRSDTFVPIDTENMDQAQLDALQNLYDESAGGLHFDAVVSTDGDSDRPLLLAIDPDTRRLHFIPGDKLGMLTAQSLLADAVVVPVSCNDAIDQGSLRDTLQPRTRIGSPHVIAGMERARQQGKQRVCGFEANGGFLTATDLARQGRWLRALPTRDAVLPLVAVLAHCRSEGISVLEACRQLPQRHGHAALRRDFPRERGQALVHHYTPFEPPLLSVHKRDSLWWGRVESGAEQPLPTETAHRVRQMAAGLADFFSPEQGFGELESINGLDGLRLQFSNGDVAHVRPSGNADELRIYAVADTPERAIAITTLALAEPDGILRRMERAVCY